MLDKLRKAYPQMDWLNMRDDWTVAQVGGGYFIVVSQVSPIRPRRGLPAFYKGFLYHDNDPVWEHRDRIWNSTKLWETHGVPNDPAKVVKDILLQVEKFTEVAQRLCRMQVPLGELAFERGRSD